jgi:DNA topoisomerase-1
MNVVIVESPSKCKKIQTILNSEFGNDYKVIACCGHFRDIKKITSDYKIEFEIAQSKIRQYEMMRKNIEEANEIILASDDDREGEAIAWHICDTFNLNVERTKRILFHEITKEAIINGMRNLTYINMNLVNAQMTRMICDRWIGYKISPFLWRNIGNNKLSAGRCQTPTLNLVYLREREIKDYKPKFLFKINTFFYGSFNDNFLLRKEMTELEECKEFLEKTRTFIHKVINIKEKESFRNSTEPFCTSSLQQHCSSIFSWSPVSTMKLAQSLYEKGFITYHRTESKSIAKEFKEKIKKWVIEKYGEEYSKMREDKKIKDMAHECIRPTDIENKDKELNDMERKLYKVIWTRTIESEMSSCKLNIFSISISSPLKNIYYERSYEEVLFLGYKILSEKRENTNDKVYRRCKEGEEIDWKSSRVEQSLKEMKQHYTEGQIIKLLDDKNIGRPSTFSSFIDKIQSRDYVRKGNYTSKGVELYQLELIKDKDMIKESKREKKITERSKIILEDLGEKVCEYLYNNFDKFFNFEYTAKMEDDLDKIAIGKLNKNDFLSRLDKELSFTFDNTSKPIIRTISFDNLPEIEEIHIYRGKNNLSDYVYIKKRHVKRPSFISLKNFSLDYKLCNDSDILEFCNLKSENF